MGELNNNSYSELLSQLMDGQLDKASEDSLYKTIANDSDLQEELRELIGIRESVKRDREAYNPSSDLTNSVFSQLGYTSPYGKVAQTAAKTGFWQTVSMKRIMPVFGLIVAGFVGWFFVGSDDNVQTNNRTTISSSFVATDSQDTKVNGSEIKKTAKAEVPVSKTSETYFINESSSAANTGEPNIAEKQETASNNAPAEAQSSENTIKPQKQFGPVYLAQGVNFSSGLSNPENIESNVIDPLKAPSSKSWFITANGIFSQLNNGMPGAGSSMFSNMNLGVHNKLTSDLTIGVKAGVEPFQIRETNAQDEIVMNEKSVLWIGFSPRFDMNFIEFFDIKPFADMTLGGSTIGVLGKGRVGLDYHPKNSYFGIKIGYEYGMINYYHLQENYKSEKTGFTAGISFKF